MSLPLGSFEEMIFFVLLVLEVFVANPFSIVNTKKQTLTKTKIKSVFKTI